MRESPPAVLSDRWKGVLRLPYITPPPPPITSMAGQTERSKNRTVKNLGSWGGVKKGREAQAMEASSRDPGPHATGWPHSGQYFQVLMMANPHFLHLLLAGDDGGGL